MDHPLSSSNPSVAMFISFLIVILMAIQTYKKMFGPKKMLPPGPKPLPIIGNLHQLTNSLPHHRFTDLGKKYGPVMYLKLGQVPCVVVSSKLATEEVLRTKDVLFAQRPTTAAVEILSYNFRGIAFTPCGDYWRQMRKIFVVHLASAKQVASFRPVREAEVASLLESIVDLSRGGHPVNLSKMFYSVMTSMISKATFGDSCKRVDAFNMLLPRIVEMTTTFNIAEYFPSIGILQSITGVKGKVIKLQKEIDDVLESVIAEYRASEKAGRTEANDILGVLLRFQDQGGPEDSLSTESIKAILFDVFAPGIETSASLLEWTMSEIMRTPEVMQKVQAEVRHCFRDKKIVDEESIHQLKYMNAVLKESMRLHSPAPVLRESHDNITIAGYDIGPKTRVFINSWAIGRDPKIWTNPEKFEPERFLYDSSADYKGNHVELIPFGAGRRMCPGMMFAMTGVELTLASLLYHFNWELPDGLKPESLDMDEIMGGVIKKKESLCLVATEYRP